MDRTAAAATPAPPSPPGTKDSGSAPRLGTNLRVVQEALGHSSLQRTSRYVSLARELMDQHLEASAL